MEHYIVMLKPVSSSCNLRCKYCFYTDVSCEREIHNYGKMTTETAVRIIENVFQNLKNRDSVIFAFQGGDPL